MKRERIETVMTYDEWKKEYKKYKRRQFVRKWNRTIDRIAEFPFGKLATAAASVALVGFIATFNINDTPAEQTETIREVVAYYSDGVVITEDGNYPYYGNFKSEGKVNVKISDMGTLTTDDDVIVSIVEVE